MNEGWVARTCVVPRAASSRPLFDAIRLRNMALKGPLLRVSGSFRLPFLGPISGASFGPEGFNFAQLQAPPVDTIHIWDLDPRMRKTDRDVILVDLFFRFRSQ